MSFILGFLLVMIMLAACVDRPGPAYDATFRVLSGAENQPLEPIIQSFARDQKAKIEVSYAGSVDIMRELANGTNSRYDAVWPASSIWILLGDSTNAVQFSSSIMRSPVVLGVKQSVAERLGWVGADVTVADVLAAAEADDFTFMMANAAQSDSGAAAYLGFLYAFAGQPDVLTSADLRNPAVQEKVKRILGTVSRSAGNSGSLKDLFLSEYDSYDGMINYESTIIETNQALTAGGREPLYALYLRDGTSIADFPLGEIAKGD
jgi:Ca-activated chloride channel family protein